MFAGCVRGLFVPQVLNYITAIARGGVILSVEIWPFSLNNPVCKQNRNNGYSSSSPNILNGLSN